ncbi:bifunctional phosphoribosyl-AMP cyclohydrolase/phosphoribosyl-ATP diphosphatase HisIE [Paenibacillus caui]|uniref:bifunctional phosphoribosyl-AMP cyclohydrolase/phosphoribosyl-ATP diphosphatase HisIE n=1 Tax=Paenibacillus caui TaxID=2873927 RepID=UPI001CAA3E80|nr:bifunctional phosphoribosyl-AMP cyclohydrolase/phosphoribosyl-ATP diphosphatase HisIE [Paenibacillus caui]
MSKGLVMQLPVEELEQKVKWDSQGLVPAIVQDSSSLEVLTLAYMNRESLRKTAESGETWFWSRSRSELWHKGATSGHTQQIVSLKYDCDGDALLVLVNRKGPACHTGEESCFYQTAGEGELPASAAAMAEGTSALGRFAVLDELERVIAERDEQRPEGTYTTYLFEKGIDKILKKVGEETAESIIAAKNKDNNELRMEVSDLIYHLLVLLRERKLPLDEVLRELSLRHERPRRD